MFDELIPFLVSSHRLESLISLLRLFVVILVVFFSVFVVLFILLFGVTA
jgi:hypothetical protein